MHPSVCWLCFGALLLQCGAVNCEWDTAKSAAALLSPATGISSICHGPGLTRLAEPADGNQRASTRSEPTTKSTDENPDTISLDYSGTLSPECVSSYYQMFVTRRVPPRNYQYFHEVDLTAPDSRATVPLKWRIVGGNEVSITNVPFQVLYGLYCGGALISPNWVLTAAHCKSKEKFVLAGSTRRSKASQYRICAHFIHPYWGKRTNQHPQDYDYQLVLLETSIPVTLSTRPIAIGDVEDIQPGAIVSVSGWGYTKYRERHMQDNLRRVFVPIIAHSVCQALPNKNYQTISPRMFCAGILNGTKDSCQGDSGGPVVLRGRLVGLVSFGVGCASKEQPGAYANVPIVRDWIRSVTALPL